MKRFSQFRQREGNRFKQRLVPFFNGVYGIYAKLRKAVGNPIVIDNASDEALFGLKVFGKSTQNGTPTPTTPVAIVSVENPTVKVDAQNLSVPYTLHGIPVTSGGNYTDENGQQWICDEVDFERGVYVKRIAQHIFNGSSEEFWYNGYLSEGENNRFEIGIPNIGYMPFSAGHPALKNAICDYFQYDVKNLGIPNTDHFRTAIDDIKGAVYLLFNPNEEIAPLEDVEAWKAYLVEHPITCILPLAVTIETPLTPDQIAAYKSLHTNEPNTTILNDQNAWMEVMYTSK